MNDLQWSRHGAGPAHAAARADEDPWSRLARDLGYTPVFLHYNSGRHVSSNGREFAGLLDALVGQWPLPVERLAIIGHSMGGLVARSACHYGAAAGSAWPARLHDVVFLGTPHHGAPLERGGNWFELVLGASRHGAAFARLGKIRSAGITDLRYGNLLDEDWEGRDRFGRSRDRRRALPLPAGVRCYALAASSGKRAGDVGDRLLGDGLVPVDSALGRHGEPGLNLPFPAGHQWVGYGMNHLDLLGAPAVLEQIRHWLAGPDATQ